MAFSFMAFFSVVLFGVLEFGEDFPGVAAGVFMIRMFTGFFFGALFPTGAGEYVFAHVVVVVLVLVEIVFGHFEGI